MMDKSSKLDKSSNNISVGLIITGGNAGSINTTNTTVCSVNSLPLNNCSSSIMAGSTSTFSAVNGGGGQKPVPMNLFAAWEVDRTPPNCIPRLCSLTVTRLTILTSLLGDMTSLSLAVKMQSSKRILRSHEITVFGAQSWPLSNTATTGAAAYFGTAPNSLQLNNTPNIFCGNIQTTTSTTTGTSSNNEFGASGTMPLAEMELELHFSLQYPHFIKRDGNRLVILLQRRKKYKSRTILGYKTLAEGFIRMDAVLQKSMDMTVDLIAPGKSGRSGTTVACLRAERVSSIPVDHDNKNNNNVLLADRVAEYSDEEEEAEFSSGEFNDETTELRIASYSVPKSDYNAGKRDIRKYHKLERSVVEDVTLGGNNPVDSDSEFEMKEKSSSRAKISRTISLQQRNFKQKIVALLKRFKVTEELEGEVNRGTASLRGDHDLDALFQELESLSCCEGDDSGPDIDSLSIGSTPKPSLRPFFTNSRIMLHDIEAEGESIERRSSDKSDQMTNSSYQIESNKPKRIHLTNNNNSATTTDRLCENRNDSSGNEINALHTDGQTSDPQNSPPGGGDKDYNRFQYHSGQYAQLTPVQTITNLQAITPQQSGSGSGGGGGSSAGAGNSNTQISHEKRSRLFRSSSSTPSGKKKQTLSLCSESRSVLETCLSPTNVEPRKIFLDQLSRVFIDDSAIPDVVTIISPPEAIASGGSCGLVAKLSALFANSFKPSFLPQNTAEVKAVLQALMGKIQKYCNSNAKPPTTVKILLIGGDWLQGVVLRHYVDLMGVRPPDWMNHLRFYIVPIGNSTIARYLGQMDQAYGSMFVSDNWCQLCDRAATTAAVVNVNANALITSMCDTSITVNQKSEIVDLVTRIQRYLHSVGPCTQIPIAEAMVNYKEEDSCQIFVPFVSDVRIGYLECPQNSLDVDESSFQCQNISAGQQIPVISNTSAAIPIGGNSHNLVLNTAATTGFGIGGGGGGGGTSSGSPPHSGRVTPPLQTPPSSASSQRDRQAEAFNVTAQLFSNESVELQVDYWPIVRPLEHIFKDKTSGTRSSDQGGKNSIKSAFRNLQVWRLPQNPTMGDTTNGLTLCFATKEKKQKQIMRLGKKKEKDRDLEREQCVEGVARLICSPKQSHPSPLRVHIDGTEWTGVKFFQLSSQWQTHVKNFPIALIGCTPMSCSELS